MVHSQAAWLVQQRETPPSFLFVHKNQMLLHVASIQVPKDLFKLDLQDLGASFTVLASVPTDTLNQQQLLFNAHSYETSL